VQQRADNERKKVLNPCVNEYPSMGISGLSRECSKKNKKKQTGQRENLT